MPKQCQTCQINFTNKFFYNFKFVLFGVLKMSVLAIPSKAANRQLFADDCEQKTRGSVLVIRPISWQLRKFAASAAAAAVYGNVCLGRCQWQRHDNGCTRPDQHSHSLLMDWWRGAAVTRFIRLTKLLYARPG